MNDPAPNQPATSDDRLLALEVQVAFQQQMLDQFHEVLLRQQAEIDKLAGTTAAFRTALDRLSAGEDLPHEKPPHY
jgi:uncharacterized coiled-coil protein SlyX